MKRGTDATFLIRIDPEKMDLTQLQDLAVTLRQGPTAITVRGKNKVMISPATGFVVANFTPDKTLLISEKEPVAFQITGKSRDLGTWSSTPIEIPVFASMFDQTLN